MTGFYVCVPSARDKLWKDMLQWCEIVLGPVGREWEIDTHPEDLIFEFSSEKNAIHFSNVWNRDPLIIPYKVWKEFCQSSISCARLNYYWDRIGWTPQSVFFCNLYGGPMIGKQNTLGGRRHYRPSLKLYFFEFETDALIHWIERYGSSYN
jgi:hypothetical protein